MPCAFSASASRGCEREFGMDILPTPTLVLEMQRGAIVNPGELTDVVV